MSDFLDARMRANSAALADENMFARAIRDSWLLPCGLEPWVYFMAL